MARKARLSTEEAKRILAAIREEEKARIAEIVAPPTTALPSVADVLAKVAPTWATTAASRATLERPVPAASEAHPATSGLAEARRAARGLEGAAGPSGPLTTVEPGVGGTYRHGGEVVTVVAVYPGTDEVLVRTARGDARYVKKSELEAAA